MILHGNHCGKLANEITFYIYIPCLMHIHENEIYQSNVPRYVWSVTEESIMVADDTHHGVEEIE